MPLSVKHKVQTSTTSVYRMQQHQYVYHHCQLGHVIPGHAIFVAVCIFMLPMLEVAAEHKQLTTTHHTVPAGGHVTFSHVLLVLPSLSNLLPVMVLQNGVVRPNMCLSRSFSHSSICHISFGLGLNVPSRLMVMMVFLLLLLSGDIETNPGPDGKKLTSDDLHCVQEELQDVSAQWYHLGVQLKLRTGTLDNIQAQFSDPKRQLLEMLKTWLTTSDNTTWKTLTGALRSRSVGASQLAENLETKYCLVPEGTLVDREVLTEDEITISEEVSLAATCTNVTNSDMHNPNTILESCSDSTSSPVSEPVQKKPRLDLDTKPEHNYSTSPPPTESFEEKLQPDIDTEHSGSSISPTPSEKPRNSPFGCGCGKCTFFSFIEKGCQTPIPTASSFPYLDHSGLTHEQQQKLEERLWYETKEIILRFQKLVSATIKSFKKQCVPLDELVSHVMQALGAFDPVWKKPVFTDYQEQIKAAKTIPQVFSILNDYSSFFNYHIIEHIIEELGTEEDKAELQRYKEDFKQYAKRRIFECPPEFGLVSDADHANIIVKVDLQFDKYTVEETKGLCHQLSKILCVSFGILRLCRVDKGCFQLMFQVPSFVQQEIFPLSREQKKALADMSVIRLTCGDYQFQNNEASQPAGIVGKDHRDPDDDSGMGPSISTTDTKSTTFSGDHLDKKMSELDYELKVQGLVETASSHKPESGLVLRFAVTVGQLENVRFFVEKEHCNPMQREQDGFAPFHIAAILGHVQVLKYFITECNCNPAFPGPLGLTPLHLASRGDHLDVVKYLVIEQQMDPQCDDDYRNTPLHGACAGGCQAVVDFLTSELKTYAPIPELIRHLKNYWNSTPLHSAVVNGNLDIVQFFVSNQNCDPNIPGGYHCSTPLHYAAEYGQLHIVKYLTEEQHCDPSCLDEDKKTPLHFAAWKGHMKIVKFFTVQKHCDPMCRDSRQCAPLHMASLFGHIEVVKFLINEMQCDPISRTSDNFTSLYLAAEMGHLDIIKFLFSDQNCDPNTTAGKFGRTTLHTAAEFGQLHIVKYLVDEQGFNPSCLDDFKDTPLHCAAINGHMDIVKYLIIEKHCDPMCTDVKQNTPLHMAAQSDHTAKDYSVDIVKFEVHHDLMAKLSDSKVDVAEKSNIDIVKFLTLEMHCDPTSRNDENDTPLHIAVIGGYLDVVQFFISEQNCDANTPGRDGRTPLHYAAEFGHLHIAKYLTDEQGCNPSCLDKDKRTPLHWAAWKGHMNIVKFLTIQKQSDPKCRDSKQITPLHIAALEGHIEVVKFLTLEKYCDPTSRLADSDTALHLAVEGGHLDIIRFFISDQNCDHNIPGQQGGTPLHCAAHFGHLHIVKYLIEEQGCNSSCSDENEYTPLHRASMQGHIDIVKYLTVEKHCDPMCRDYDQATPLHKAAECGHLYIVKYLIDEQGCNPSCLDKNKYTPLHFAARKGHINIVKFLILEKRCDPMCRNSEQFTPLHLTHNIEIVKFLILEMHCDPTSRNAHNTTALHIAAIEGHLDIVQFISNQKCGPNIPGQYGTTPLHCAAQSGHLHIVKYLTDEQDCDTSCLDDLKYTPLYRAALGGHIDIVKFLTLEKHCDPMLQDRLGLTVLHCAVREGHLDIVKFLIEELKCPSDISAAPFNVTPLQIAIYANHPNIVRYLQKHSILPYIYTAIVMIKQLGLLK